MFAGAVDDFDNNLSFHHKDHDLYHQYFNGDWSVHSDPADDGSRKDVFKVKKIFNILFRYCLLDILANVIGVPRHPSLQVIEKRPMMAMPQRLKDVSH